MSVEVMTQVFASSLPRSQRLVLLAIADHVNDDGEGCWASYDRLEYKTDYERRQVMRIVDQLEQNGIIIHKGKHPKYGTNIWNIARDKIPMKPPFQEWLKEKRANDKDLQPIDSEGRQNVTPSRVTFSHEGRQNVTPEVAEMSPNPSSLHPLEENRESTVAFATGAPPLNGNGKTHKSDLSNWTDLPANERPNVDHLIEYGSDEEDAKAKMRPRTDLERKILSLCGNSVYITDNQRAVLNTRIIAAYGKQRPQEYPSPEEEWKANPDLFNEYVEMCAKMHTAGALRAPSRSALITLITRYTRRKTGWLDFKDFGIAADAPVKQIKNKYYYDPSKPAWDQ